jgi:hypothetical protein
MKKLLMILAIMMLLLTSCMPPEKKDFSQVVARVDGEILTLNEIRESFGTDVWLSMNREEQQDAIQKWVDMTILSTFALKDDDIQNNEALEFIIKNNKKKIYANALISSRLNNLVFSEEESLRYYQLHQSEFTENIREYWVQRIFFKEEEAMQRVKRLLDSKQILFTAAAQAYSEEPIGRNGGYMGLLVTKTGADSLLWKAMDKMDKFFETTMRYNGGYIIARYYDSKLVNYNNTFYNVREKVEDMLREEKINDVYEEVFNEAKEKANVYIEY